MTNEEPITEPPIEQTATPSLESLLARCDPDASLSTEDEAWLAGDPLGSELI